MTNGFPLLTYWPVCQKLNRASSVQFRRSVRGFTLDTLVESLRFFQHLSDYFASVTCTTTVLQMRIFMCASGYDNNIAKKIYPQCRHIMRLYPRPLTF